MPRPAVANNTLSLARTIDDIDRSAIMQVRKMHEADLGAMLEIAEAVFQSFEDRRFISRKISCRVEVLQEHETVWLYIGAMLPTSTDSDIEAVVTLTDEREIHIPAAATTLDQGRSRATGTRGRHQRQSVRGNRSR